MPLHPLRQPSLLAGALTGLLLATPPAVTAGGMALTMQDGVHLGQTFSAGASAEDASTVYWNPAGLAWLSHNEALVGACYFFSSGGFTNDGSLTGGLVSTAGGDGGTALSSTLIPSMHFAWPVSDELAFGLGVSAPFGLATDYDAAWVGRYHALKSELSTLNINPAFSWRPVDWMALGLGLDWQRADAELTNAIDFGLLGFLNEIPGFAPGSADGHARLQGDDWSTGFNLGVLFEPVDGTRIGLHYRSKMSHHLSGDATFADVPAPFAAMFPDQSATAALPLPAIISLSLHHDFSPTLAVTADWSRWDWSSFESLAVDMENPATPDTSLRQDWKDASIVSAGVRWQPSESLILRAGVALNESPVPSAELRSPRIPDSDRTWVGAGLSWFWSDALRLDAGYAHLFIDEATARNDDGAGHLLAGSYSVSVNILSAQLTWQY